MANGLMAAYRSLDPWLVVVVLVTFALILLWFKRRALARRLPSVAQDFLTRHVETVKRRYPYSG